MKLARLAAAAAMLKLGTGAVVPQAQAQAASANGATGRTVISVSFAQGQFRRDSDGSWVELDARGDVAFRFRETGRDDWSVYLQKQGAPHEVQLDLWRGMITLSVNGGPRTDLYPITGAQAPGMVSLPGGAPIGLSLRRVSYADGYFQQTGANGEWTEYNAQGRPIYFFREESRAANAVVLFDASRGTAVEFNLLRRIVRISFNRAPFEDLYPITATHNANGPLPTSAPRPGNLPPPNQLPSVNLPQGFTPDYSRQASFFVEAGPLTSQLQAETNCAALGYRIGGDWTGGWQRRDGRQSVCEFRFNGGRGGGGGSAPTVREFEVGPIWSQSDAEQKCRSKANELRGEWTGQWRTTQTGRMSVCEIRLR